MPTGYTAAIEDGCTFEEFVWGCARAFGACVTMRDAGPAEPVPDEFQPSSYHAERIAAAEAELERLSGLTHEEVEAAIESERQEVVAANARRAMENEQKKARYDAILERVRAWEPPTPEHAGVKEFMLQQIDVSIPGEPYQEELPVSHPAGWLAARKAKAQEDLAYHQKGHAKELERTRGRNEWIAALRESVPQPPRRPA